MILNGLGLVEPGTFTLWDRVSLIKDSLNSSIRIQIKARISTLCSQFIPQNITALPLAINLLLVSKELFFHHGHTHRSQPSEQLRQLWPNVVDDEKP